MRVRCYCQILKSKDLSVLLLFIKQTRFLIHRFEDTGKTDFVKNDEMDVIVKKIFVRIINIPVDFHDPVVEEY